MMFSPFLHHFAGAATLQFELAPIGRTTQLVKKDYANVAAMQARISDAPVHSIEHTRLNRWLPKSAIDASALPPHRTTGRWAGP
jgi:hypothetical protein